jgi:hypothetical protein
MNDAEKQLKSFVAKFDPRHQTLIRAVRKVLRQRFPTANELVYDNYNFFVIGYSPTERPSDAIVSIAAAANDPAIRRGFCAWNRLTCSPATRSRHCSPPRWVSRRRRFARPDAGS